MDLETIQRHATIAFDLMCGLRADQTSPAYIHAAKAWMALDSELRAAQRAAKKAAKEAPKIETLNTEPEPQAETADKAANVVTVPRKK